MFDSPYPFCSLGKSDTNERNPHRKMFYKFYAKYRTYLVTLEFYEFQVVAIKFCDVKDKNSPKAYHKIFNDCDAPKVIGTCFHIMLHYWQKNKDVNFVFYASLRNITKELLERKNIPVADIPKFIDRYKRARYIIYRYGMVNLFSYDDFTQLSDKDNCVYALINKRQPDPGAIVSELEIFLRKNHNILFNPIS